MNAPSPPPSAPLVTAERPATAWAGVRCPPPAWSSCRFSASPSSASAPGSAAVRGEGADNLICACLAAAVLAGLLANTVLRWWWPAPAIALVIAAMAVHEVLETWQGYDEEEAG